MELSCERLLMKYLDSFLDDSTDALFERLDGELRGVNALRLVEAQWLSRQDLRDRLDPLLNAFRRRGGELV